jgi:hypothetical protein
MVDDIRVSLSDSPPLDEEELANLGSAGTQPESGRPRPVERRTSQGVRRSRESEMLGGVFVAVIAGGLAVGGLLLICHVGRALSAA